MTTYKITRPKGLYHITKPDHPHVQTYCGSMFDYALHLHFWLMDGAQDEGFCPDCLASDELGLDLLTENGEVNDFR